MSNKITKKTINDYLNNVTEAENNELVLEYAVDKQNTFEIKLKKRLNLAERSEFISIVSNAIFADGEYRPEYEEDLYKVAFFMCFIKNIDVPKTSQKQVDTGRIVEIIDGLEILTRYINECGDGELRVLHSLCDRKIEYNKSIYKTTAISHTIKNEIIANFDVILELLGEALETFENDEIAMDIAEDIVQ